MNATFSNINSSDHTAAGKRALVLGGGGATGNAWLLGMVAGLFDAGLDVTDAELTVGTSAGSTTAAQLVGASPTELFAAAVTTTTPTAGPRPRRPAADHLDRFRQIISSSADLADMRRRMGELTVANEAESEPNWQAQWRSTVASRVGRANWPARPLFITAVDATNGDPVTFDRGSGVELVDAVAASCAGGGLPYRINGVPYIDGGYRANAENADLAAGCDRVLVLSPLGGKTLHPPQWRTSLAAQVAVLRSAGSWVETVVPDEDSEHLFGMNAMDLSLRPTAARVGYGQGRAQAANIINMWR